jgi:Mor family transcriptional regulator
MTPYELTEVAEQDLMDLRGRVIETNGRKVARKIVGELDETLTQEALMI